MKLTHKDKKGFIEFVMAGIPAKGEYEIEVDITTDEVYDEYVFFKKKHMYFMGIVGERKGKKVPAFAFGVMGCGAVGEGMLYLTLEEIREEYPGVYAIMMTPEREPEFALCVEGDYEDHGLVVYA